MPLLSLPKALLSLQSRKVGLSAGNLCFQKQPQRPQEEGTPEPGCLVGMGSGGMGDGEGELLRCFPGPAAWLGDAGALKDSWNVPSAISRDTVGEGSNCLASVLCPRCHCWQSPCGPPRVLLPMLASWLEFLTWATSHWRVVGNWVLQLKPSPR